MNGSGYSSIILLVLMIVIFYVFLMLPENKKKKKLNEMFEYYASKGCTVDKLSEVM